LSENADFSEAVEAAGAVFIGPERKAIEAMGDKLISKKVAQEAGVNIIPGFQGVIRDLEHAREVANEIGYPVMIKASAGGGGKGMRIAHDDETAEEAFTLAKQESLKFFADDRLLVEKFILQPRHIEIQLLADTHGNVACIAERECSIQRRNQKVVEEAPSVLLTPEVRAEMHRQGALLARAVEYRGAGTIEFLVGADLSFYFLEMNTRLQVEHPITEKISKVDLVEEMIHIAAGHELPKEWPHGPVASNDISVPFKGHAIEARVYAEQPLRGFLPSTGRLYRYKEPLDLEGVRVDSGIEEGSEVSMFYDPMISKLITFGEDRTKAIELMKRALDEYVIRGVENNMNFLMEIVRNEKFVSGNLTTLFIEENYPKGFKGVKLTRSEQNELLALATHAFVEKRGVKEPLMLATLRGADLAPIKVSRPVVEGDTWTFNLVEDEGKGAALNVVLKNLQVDWDAMRIRYEIFDEALQTFAGRSAQFVRSGSDSIKMLFRANNFTVHVRSERIQKFADLMPPPSKGVVDQKVLRSAMPGLMLSVDVEVGEEVKAGQKIATMESMKMQITIKAATSGKVKKIVKAGQSVMMDDVLMEVEPLKSKE
jgi:propionyl-CoA carboxylase alpha chain